MRRKIWLYMDFSNFIPFWGPYRLRGHPPELSMITAKIVFGSKWTKTWILWNYGRDGEMAQIVIDGDNDSICIWFCDGSPSFPYEFFIRYFWGTILIKRSFWSHLIKPFLAIFCEVKKHELSFSRFQFNRNHDSYKLKSLVWWPPKAHSVISSRALVRSPCMLASASSKITSFGIFGYFSEINSDFLSINRPNYFWDLFVHPCQSWISTSYIISNFLRINSNCIFLQLGVKTHYSIFHQGSYKTF